MNDYFKYIIIMRLHCNIDECLRIVPKYDFLAWVSLLRWLNINYNHEPCLSFSTEHLKNTKKGEFTNFGNQTTFESTLGIYQGCHGSDCFRFGSVLIFDVGFRFSSSNCILFVFHIQNMFSSCKLYFFNDKHKTITKWRLENRNVPRRAT